MNNKLLVNLHNVITDLEKAGMVKEASAMQKVFVKVAGENEDYEKGLGPMLFREMGPEGKDRKVWKEAIQGRELSTVDDIQQLIQKVRTMKEEGRLSPEMRQYFGQGIASLLAELHN
jgi:hypothetical protein